MTNVTLDKVVKRYGQIDVVRGVDLTIEEGELVVLLGPSGCGKTTTLRMIAGFIEPSTGEIRMGVEVVNRKPPRLRNLGMVFQDYALFPNMTVAGNIAFGLEERRAPAAQRAARVEAMLAMIRMEHLAGRYPSELSGGQQQRVALARALAYEPAVLLMDEPLGALDQKLREEMQREFARIQRSVGITTIFVTHDQQEAMMLADRIVVMNGGVIEQAGTAEALYHRPASLFIADFIGRSNKFQGVVERLEGGEAQIRLGGGCLIRTAAPAGVAAKAKVTCVVRPENLHAGRADLDNAVEARVLRRSFLGDSVDIMLELDGQEEIILKAGRADLANLPENGRLMLGFARRDVACFPASERTS
ncbi:ABC transporter ATP-binding protein [Bosea sp. NBC_00550]|uniref:ABC transporter ATP-binding protein n=1 Tax=Bosea sp. NBC_00550 TaxID=2969621 RepID=UPI00222E797C|nr:ABC transporter ATP-binding protein [Bosea sp. NBC_00550]UZF94997.1 ABC transporter ATP-binding protein [Bosea sp. NBC_00550]